MTTLRVARYRFDIEFTQPARLPVYKGSTLRGGFGYAFQAMACGERPQQNCRSHCQQGNDCPYGYIFEPVGPRANADHAGSEAVPRPFVIEPPLDRRRDFQPVDRLSFHIVVIGRAIRYLPHFMLAFQELGRRGIGQMPARFVLQRILAEHPWDGRRHLIFDGIEMHIGGPDLSVGWSDVAEHAAGLDVREVRLNLLTPTRLTRRDEVVGRPGSSTQPEFSVLVRALLRRIVDLSRFHAETPVEMDLRGLTACAGQVALSRLNVNWVDWERYSTRQKASMNLGGLVGTMEYRGDVGPFREILTLGELIHVGKSTVFGHGWYRLADSSE